MRAELEGTLGVSPAEAGDLESRCSLPCSVQSFSGKHVFFPTLWHSSRVKFQLVNSCKKGVQILALNPPRRVCRAVCTVVERSADPRGYLERSSTLQMRKTEAHVLESSA